MFWKGKKMSKKEENIELKEVTNVAEDTEESADQQEVTKIFRPLQGIPKIIDVPEGVGHLPPSDFFKNKLKTLILLH